MDRMRRPIGPSPTATWRISGHAAAWLALVLAGALADPAQAQWRTGTKADPSVVTEAPAADLAGYAQMVDLWGDRLGAAVQEVLEAVPTDPQEGALSQPRMHLLDVAQTAWVVIRQVPEEFDDHAAYQQAARQFRHSISAMRVAMTPTPEALDEARKVIAALEDLEEAAANAARRRLR